MQRSNQKLGLKNDSLITFLGALHRNDWGEGVIYLIALIPPLIWGISPMAIRWTQETYSPYWAFALRSCVAALLGLPVIWWGMRSKNERRHSFSHSFILEALISSIFLFFTIFLSNHAYAFTTVAKSVFFASTYVFLVPLWKMMFLRERYSWLSYGSLCFALIGLGTICRFDFVDLNAGDLLALSSAVFFSGYMLFCESHPASTSQPFLFCGLQCLVIAPLSLLLALWMEGPRHVTQLLLVEEKWWQFPSAFWGLFILGGLVSWVSYSIQGWAQNVLPSHVVAVFLLLNSPLACLAGYVFMGEIPSYTTIMGGTLIFCASILMVWSQVSLRGRRVTLSDERLSP